MSLYLDSLVRKRDNLRKELSEMTGVSSNKDMSVEIDIHKAFSEKRNVHEQLAYDFNFIQIRNNIMELNKKIDKLLDIKEHKVKEHKWTNYYQKK